MLQLAPSCCAVECITESAIRCAGGVNIGSVTKSCCSESYRDRVLRLLPRVVLRMIILRVLLCCCAGSIRRQSTDRVSRLCYDQPGEVLACQTTGKLLDFFK